MPTSPERRFTERQVATVLRTATELQERDGALVPGKGLTLAQLEQIAGEAGIDQAVLRRALARLDEGPPQAGDHWFLGGPSDFVVERVVEGEVAPEDFERLLAIVRRLSGQLGESSVVGRLFGWTGKVDDASAQVSVSSEAGFTTVRVRISPEQHMIGHFMLKGMLGGVGGGIVGAGVSSTFLGGVGAIVGVAILGVGYFAARRGYRRDVQQLRGRAADIADALAATCVAKPGRPAPP